MADPNYWTMTDADLASRWREVSAANFADDPDGDLAERLSFVEDAILQRVGAPDDASGDDPVWQGKIREFGEVRA